MTANGAKFFEYFGFFVVAMLCLVAFELLWAFPVMWAWNYVAPRFGLPELCWGEVFCLMFLLTGLVRRPKIEKKT